MTDTLLILPTIGANVEKAVAALKAARETMPHDIPCFVMLDEGTDEQRAMLKDAMMPMSGVPGIQHFGSINWSETRRGLVCAYRAGFEEFASEFRSNCNRLILLEDNVIVTPGWFDALSRTLDAHPEFGWVACGQQENDAAPFTSLCSMLTRECALALDGGPDLAFAPCQFDDGDMFMRALKAGFRPHAIPHKVSHPEARTSREGTLEDDWRLIEAHRVIFQQRWGLSDFPWAYVPVHRGCGRCDGVA